MERGVYIAVTGSSCQDRKLEVITYNLAGSNVAGFKKDLPVFKIYQPAQSEPAPSSVERLLGKPFVNLEALYTDFSQGPLEATGAPLDLAISGEGFFVVQTPEGRYYTRKGNFIVNDAGQLATVEGYPIEGETGPINITPGEIDIDQQGIITIDGNRVGRIKVVTFPQPYPLRKIGKSFFAPIDRGIEEKTPTDYVIKQGYLESANVNTVEEMVSLIEALRCYEVHLKLVEGFDDLTQKAIKLANNR